jgi:serine/threonine-protein kinase
MSLIGKSVGNYRITAKLGEGGMGAVYMGEHPLIGKRVAVKVLLEELASNEEIVSRFFNEAKAVNDIGHQNIVDIVDFGKMPTGHGGPDIVYFVMEFLDGESLASRVRKGGVSMQETLHIMSQCCSALSASHNKKIVHRDLKPDNIYLCPRGNDKNFVKILDFGIAKLTGDSGQSMKTRTGLVIGTPTYMSPEQCEGKGHIDHRSDVYSLGVVMYELLTGRVPFPGDGFGEVLVAHLTRTPENPSALNPDIPPEIEALVLHAIEKDKNRRFQDMAEFQAAIENPGAHLQQYSPLPGYTPQSGPGAGTMMLPSGNTGRGAAPRVTQAGMGAPRTTTLSGASGQVAAAGGRGSRAGLFAIAGVIVALGIGGAVWFFQSGQQSGKPAARVVDTTKVDDPPPKPKEENVTVTISSEPPGATVERFDGTIAGTTPLELKVKKGSAGFDVKVRMDGYKMQTRTVATNNDKELVVALVKNEPLQPAAPVPQPVAATTPKASRPHSSRPKKSSGGDSGGGIEIMQPNF